MAYLMARNGGLGVIHRNLDINSQVKEIKKVKRYDLMVVQLLEHQKMNY